jgi:hypothetical protein
MEFQVQEPHGTVLEVVSQRSLKDNEFSSTDGAVLPERLD